MRITEERPRESVREMQFKKKVEKKEAKGVEVKRFGTRDGLNPLPLALNMEKGPGPMCGL